MGGAPSRRPDVHVVLVSPSENGRYDASAVRKLITESTVTSATANETRHSEEDSERRQKAALKRSSPEGLKETTQKRGRIDSKDSFHTQSPTSSSPRKLNSQTSFASNIVQQSATTNTINSYQGNRYHSNSNSTPSSRTGYQSLSFVKPKRSQTDDTLKSKSFAQPIKSTDATESGDSSVARCVSNDDHTPSASNMFELFQLSDGREFTVYVREDGKRFYVDWEDQKWRHFPSDWEKKGTFVPMDSSVENGADTNGSIHTQMIEIQHNTKGKIYMWYQKEYSNKLYFYHSKSGSWVAVPLAWECQVPQVAQLIKDIQSTIPSWTDKLSIVATLRQCNYNVDEAISTYLTLKDEGILEEVAQETSPTQTLYIEQLKKELIKSNAALKELKERNAEYKRHIEEQQMRIDELENELDEQSILQASAASELRHLFPTNGRYGNYRRASLSEYAELVCLLAQICRSMKAKLLASKNTLYKMIDSFKNSLSQLSGAVLKLNSKGKSLESELAEIKVLYRKEFHQRKLLHNELLELKGNVRVFCRCRPDEQDLHILSFSEEGLISCPTLQGKLKTYEFDKVFDPLVTQETIYEEVRPVVTSAVDGYNVCIIAYGQTSTGKTYTMMGPEGNPGVNVRSLRELFNICKKRENINYSLRVSMIEIYNETISDLLLPPEEIHRPRLQIQKSGRDVTIPGLTEVEVKGIGDIEKVIRIGDKNRRVANTVMNTNSSRSHLLLVLDVVGHDLITGNVSEGRLTLVDLAGSERISRTEAKGMRLVEAAAINKSLSALGQVFTALRNNALHIPYRNSKLTHFLSSSLGGDAKACMFVTVSPVKSNQGETLSTLEFGQSTRQVELGKASKHIRKLPLPVP